MGVPKLYQWFRMRYPLAQVKVRWGQVPAIDNLYLDLNDMIHVLIGRVPKKKPRPLQRRIKRFFQELDLVIARLKPRKLIYLAVDGAAPLAKLSLQRARRFATARREVRSKLSLEGLGEAAASISLEPAGLGEEENVEEEDIEEEPLEDFEEIEDSSETLINVNIPLSQIPECSGFSSSWITPGTPFMRDLSLMIKDHITAKLNDKSDASKWWQIPSIIYSGSEVPGEGEHKVVDYIRRFKDKGAKVKESTHCLFGSDADLVLLGLAQHVPNILCLRKPETTKFNRKNRMNSEPVTLYEGLSLTLLKECLIKELYFKQTRFPANPRFIVDDVILLLTLLGNDFLPHVKRFTIDSGTPHQLLITYIYYLEYGPGHINPNGHINFDNLRAFFRFYPKTIKDHYNCPVAKDLLKQLEMALPGPGPGPGTGPDPGSCMIQNKLDFLHTQLLYTKLPSCPLTFTPQIVPAKANDSTLQAAKVTAPFLKPKSIQLGILVTRNDASNPNPNSNSNPNPNPNSKSNAKLSFNNKTDSKPVLNETTEAMDASATDGNSYLEGLQWVMSYYYRGLPAWDWSYGNHKSVSFTDLLKTKANHFHFELGTPLPPYGVLLATLPPNHASLLPKPLQGLMRMDDSPLAGLYNLQNPAAVDTSLIEAQLRKGYVDLSPAELDSNHWGNPLLPKLNNGVWSLQPTFLGSSLPLLNWHAIPNRVLANGFHSLSSVYCTNLPHVRSPAVATGSQSILLNDPFSHLPPLALAEFLIGKVNVLVHWPATVQGNIVAISNATTRWSMKDNLVTNRLLSAKEQNFWQSQVVQLIKLYSDQLHVQLGKINLLVHYLVRANQICRGCHLPIEKVAPIQSMLSIPTPDHHPYLKRAPNFNEGCWSCQQLPNQPKKGKLTLSAKFPQN